MIDSVFWLGRLAMAALMLLFLLRLAVILARPADATGPRPAPKKPAARRAALRLLQGENQAWYKTAQGEKALTSGQQIDIDRILTLGRAPGNDIRLDDPFASAFHARIRVQQHGLVLEDLDTTNGTRVNGVRINGPVRVEPGDIIDVGSTSFIVEE
jgi:hypothetical protein